MALADQWVAQESQKRHSKVTMALAVTGVEGGP
jgi:hypothetical protein